MYSVLCLLGTKRSGEVKFLLDLRWPPRLIENQVIFLRSSLVGSVEK